MRKGWTSHLAALAEPPARRDQDGQRLPEAAAKAD